MQHPNRIVVMSFWTALFVAALMFSGVANAQLSKDEQKCVNTSNKNAQKIADAQAKNYNSCIKDFAKGKNGSADTCTAADAKGKLSKANSKYDSKTAKDCTMGSGFMNLADNTSVKAIAKDKELAILEMIFGTDGGIDGAIIPEATDKTNSKCQQAIVKAVFKCQATKWKEYNSCKKNKIKGKDTTQATSASEVQDECTGTGAGSIPDGKGKIAKKCNFSSTISKKCPNNVFPGCPGDAAALNACLDAFVECKWCLANNAIDGLVRNCDEFDNGVEDGSCESATTCNLSEEAFCEGGANDTLPCTDTIAHSDCSPGPPTARCIQNTHFLIRNTVDPNGVPLFALPVGGDLTLDCGIPDPNTGIAACTCNLINPVPFNIPAIGFICLSTFEGCKDGFIDCGGSSSVDTDTIGRHDVTQEAASLDPNQFTPGFGCGELDIHCVGMGDPNCAAQEQCVAMCTTYCASLGGNFEFFDAGCEGFCEFGSSDRLPCTLDADCPQGLCIGADPVTHGGGCNCTCLELAGPSGGAGAMECEIGVGTQLESAAPCDGVDITTTIGAQCVPLTTGDATATLFEANKEDLDQIDGSLRSGSAISCNDFYAGNLSGLTFAGNQTFFDSDVGDLISIELFDCE